MITKTNIPNIKDIVNLFVKNGVDPNEPDSFNIYPLIYACKMGLIENIKILMSVDNIDFLHQNNDGNDALNAVKIANPNIHLEHSNEKEEIKDNEEIKDKRIYLKILLLYINKVNQK